jgi:tRNA pseudouridine38-40 synthase
MPTEEEVEEQPQLTRYFAEIAYKGTRFNGLQRQPNGPSVQQTIEDSLSVLLRQPTEIVGCGRTDAGVHASQYFLHFDYPGQLPDRLLEKLNHMVGTDIFIKRFIPVHPTAHARFNAVSRSYQYHINLTKNPFNTETALFLQFKKELDINKLNEAAALFAQADFFKGFCKTGGAPTNFKCQVTASFWELDTQQNQLIYNVTANRFLRGMVRLLVGSCLNFALDKTAIEDLENALKTGVPPPKTLSVFPQGLFLTDIKYPFI